MLYLLFPHSVSCNHIVNENAHNRNLRNSYVMEELHSYIEKKLYKKDKAGKKYTTTTTTTTTRATTTKNK